MITDRDIVVKVIAQGKDPKSCLAGELGGEEVVTIGADDDAREILSTMGSPQGPPPARDRRPFAGRHGGPGRRRQGPARAPRSAISLEALTTDRPVRLRPGRSGRASRKGKDHARTPGTSRHPEAVSLKKAQGNLDQGPRLGRQDVRRGRTRPPHGQLRPEALLREGRRPLGAQGEEGPVGPPGRQEHAQGRPDGRGADANASKQHLYDVAKRLDVPGRSSMSKTELVDAIKKANRRATAKSR